MIKVKKEFAPHLLAAIDFASNPGENPTLRTLQIQEDTILKADWKDGHWDIEINDVFSGKCGKVQWSPQEFAAVQFIVYNGDEQTGPLDNWNDILVSMYEIAEAALMKFPEDVRGEVRPVP